MDVDDDLAGSGDRVGHLGQVQYLRPAMLLEQHRFHGLLPMAFSLYKRSSPDP
jgi:hypothetical protein